MYDTLKFLHILLVAIAVGFNASYGILLARAARQPEHEPHVLRTVKFLDDRFANPAYALLLVTGVFMVLVGPWTFRTFWIAASIGLWVVVAAVGLLAYTPALRRQIALIEEKGPGDPEYRAAATRSTLIGIALAVPVLVIVGLMVFKPTL
ncbi:MAG: DUF2269 domain-containing protein [Actinomycetota bacterium]|nr:DUF2269 domain-containing protein [Actinomycetota bacterium]